MLLGLLPRFAWMPPALLGLQFADGGLWDFSAFIIVGANSCNDVSAFIPWVLFLWRTPAQKYYGKHRTLPLKGEGNMMGRV